MAVAPNPPNAGLDCCPNGAVLPKGGNQTNFKINIKFVEY